MGHPGARLVAVIGPVHTLSLLAHHPQEPARLAELKLSVELIDVGLAASVNFNKGGHIVRHIMRINRRIALAESVGLADFQRVEILQELSVHQAPVHIAPSGIPYIAPRSAPVKKESVVLLLAQGEGYLREAPVLIGVLQGH